MYSRLRTKIEDALKPFTLISEKCLGDLLEKDRPVAGVYCAYAPEELIRAAGIYPVVLCGTDEGPIPAAESVLPAALCPLIKSSYGFALSDTCPYFSAADIIIGETTCDGKKKMFEHMAKMKRTHVIQLPYAQNNSDAQDFWFAELVQFQKVLEEVSGVAISPENIQREVDLINTRNEKLMEIAKVMSLPHPVIKGSDILTIMDSRNAALHLKEFNTLLDDFIKVMQEVQKTWDSAQKAPTCKRIIITGCPMGKGSDKVLNLLEELGATIVAQEHCGGLKTICNPVELGEEPLRQLAQHYLALPCACMSPNDNRKKYLLEIGTEFSADAFVDMSLQNCHPYTIEHHSVAGTLENEGYPVLHITTGYSPSDTEQIRVRLEAFLEML